MNRLASDFSGPVQPLLELVSERVASLARRGHPALGEAPAALAERPGKMVRPTLLLLSSLAGPPGPPDPPDRAERRKDRLVAAAAAFELLHLASLTHDDIIDSSALRRGRPSVWGRWGAEVAILTGDLLFGHAAGQAALAGKRACRSLVRVISALVTGEAMELEAAGNHLGRRAYMALATAKTAVFCAESCALGAALGGADRAVARDLRRFGLALGQAYQLTDDLLDWQGSPAGTGKPGLADLAGGRLTLPVIIGLTRRPARIGRRIAELRQAPSPDERRALLEDIRGQLAASGAFEETASVVRRKTAAAIDHLARLPAGAPRDHLSLLAGELSRRTA